MGLYDRGYVRNPFDDDQRSFSIASGTPMVTLIIVVTVLFHLADFLTNEKILNHYLALHSDTWRNPLQWFQFATYALVHDPKSLMHIAFNMVALFMLGRGVEERLGRFEFLRFYIISIVMGGLFSNLWTGIAQKQAHSVIGASGGVEAVCMLFVLYMPQAILLIWGVVPVKAWVLGVVMIASNFVFTTDTAVEVHLAGIAFAAIYFYYQLQFDWLSLSGWSEWLKQRRRLRTRGKLKVHAPPEPLPSSDAVEADRLLDKIHQHGESSLTAAERRVLERYSRQMRERRGRD